MLAAMAEPARGRSRARGWSVLAVAVLAVAVGLPALDDEPVHDDVPLVVADPRVQGPGGLVEVWTSASRGSAC